MYSFENSTIEEYRRFDFFTIVGVFSLISRIITLFSIQFLLLTVFPFFVIVSRSNRENDKKYALNLVFYYFRKASPIFYNANTLVFYVSVSMTNAHHIILMLSAIQKFCLYFFQNFESYLNLSKKAVHRILFCIHLIVQVKQLIYWNNYRENNYSIDTIIDPMTIDLFIMFGLLISSSFLYIPILISIKKRSHLISVVKNRPDRYVLIQTGLIIVLIVAAISFYIFTTYREVETLKNKMEAVYRLRELDNNSTPVLIQISYLLSSQKNIDKVKELLSVKKFFKSLFPCWFKTSAVQPISYIDLMETTINS